MEFVYVCMTMDCILLKASIFVQSYYWAAMCQIPMRPCFCPYRMLFWLNTPSGA